MTRRKIYDSSVMRHLQDTTNFELKLLKYSKNFKIFEYNFTIYPYQMGFKPENTRFKLKLEINIEDEFYIIKKEMSEDEFYNIDIRDFIESNL